MVRPERYSSGVASEDRFRIALRASGMTTKGAQCSYRAPAVRRGRSMERQASTKPVIPEPLALRVSGTRLRLQEHSRTPQAARSASARDGASQSVLFGRNGSVREWSADWSVCTARGRNHGVTLVRIA